MDERVLFVDDEKNVLEGIQRRLRRRFEVTTAPGPEQGLEAVEKNGPFAVIVSDLRMPGMDGIRFLARSRELAPDSVRMVLTGNADLHNAIQAVNQGHVFRFLTKPCDRDTLVRVLELGIRQYRLIMAERELLQMTLRGSIRMLTDLLALVNPEAFGRAARIKRYAREIAGRMKLADAWRVETAAMLSQIGCVVLSEEVLGKISRGGKLTSEEQQAYDMHPGIGGDLLSRIPRMKQIAEIISLQEKGYDGTGIPPLDTRRGDAIPMGARILKAVLDFDMHESRGMGKAGALAALEKRKALYDPDVLEALAAVLGMEARHRLVELKVRNLKPDMVLNQDVRTNAGQLVLSRGQEISPLLLKRLIAFTEKTSIQEPIRVYVPLDPPGRSRG
ncbi:MAG: response regulator [Deltaproteobacteria bacterium]|nr:response regulator [Deltaproteobacteria bacterium]